VFEVQDDDDDEDEDDDEDDDGITCFLRNDSIGLTATRWPVLFCRVFFECRLPRDDDVMVRLAVGMHGMCSGLTLDATFAAFG